MDEKIDENDDELTDEDNLSKQSSLSRREGSPYKRLVNFRSKLELIDQSINIKKTIIDLVIPTDFQTVFVYFKTDLEGYVGFQTPMGVF